VTLIIKIGYIKKEEIKLKCFPVSMSFAAVPKMTGFYVRSVLGCFESCVCSTQFFIKIHVDFRH
jgi:hypothetical protein